MTIRKILATTALALALSAGQMAHAQPGDGPGGKGEQGQRMEEQLSKLPPEKADLFRATMKESRAKTKELRVQIKKLHEEMKTLLTAETFDKTAFLAKAAEIDTLHSQMASGRHAAMAKIAESMTREERKIIAEMHPKGHKRKKAAHGEDMPPPEGDNE